MLLWLWCRLAAIALKTKKRKRKKKEKERKRRKDRDGREAQASQLCYGCLQSGGAVQVTDAMESCYNIKLT